MDKLVRAFHVETSLFIEGSRVDVHKNKTHRNSYFSVTPLQSNIVPYDRRMVSKQHSPALRAAVNKVQQQIFDTGSEPIRIGRAERGSVLQKRKANAHRPREEEGEGASVGVKTLT